MEGDTVKQATLQTFGKPPLPKGYSPYHILTYDKCGNKFLLIYIYKVHIKPTYQPIIEGSDLHTDISLGNFESEYPETQKMLDIARKFLLEMPSNPVFETSIKDKNNPGTYRGTIFNLPFLAVFDVHWINERIGADWKRSKHNKKYDDSYEIQAYILNELFRQKYGLPLKKFYFVFLKDGKRYEAQSIYPGEVRDRIEMKIKNVLDSIRRFEFRKNVSWSCQWCECRGLCI